MLWNLIKNLTRKDAKDNHIRQLKDGEKILSDKQDMSELLNTFFVTQPRKILSSILTSASAALPQSNALVNDGVEFQVPNITTDQIKELLLSIPCHKATRLDGISARVLKVAAPSISSSLARLINHCIETGEFPSKWKSAKVTPIYKGCGSREDMNNYRPISILPLLSKLLEKHVHHFLYSYLTKKSFSTISNRVFGSGTPLRQR